MATGVPGGAKAAQLPLKAAPILGDGLATRYTSLADDGSTPAPMREAAMLFAVAENHLDENEDYEEAHKTALDALKLFREAADKKGAAECVRIVVTSLRMKAQAERYARGLPAQQGAIAEAKNTAQAALTTAQEEGDKNCQACMFFSLAEVNYDCGDAERAEALAHAKEARSLFQELQDKQMEANVCLFIATCHLAELTFKEGKEAAMEALDMVRTLGDKRGEARGLQLSAIAISRGPLTAEALQQGAQALTSALAIARELGKPKLVAYHAYFLALWHLMMENHRAALAPAKEAVEVFGKLEYGKGWQPTAQDTLIRALIGKADAKEALRVAGDAVAVFKGEQDKRSQIYALENLIHAHLACFHKGDMTEALQACEEGAALCRQVDELKWEANMLHNTAQVYLRLNELDNALTKAKAASDMLGELGEKSEQSIVLVTLCDVHQARGEMESALEVTSTLRENYQQLGRRKREAEVCLLAASLQVAQQNFTEALKLSSDAQAVFQAEGDKKSEAVAWGVIVDIRQALGDQVEMVRAMRTQQALFSQAGDTKALAYAFQACSQAFTAMDQPDQAAKAAGDALSMARKAMDLQAEVEMLILVAQSSMATLCRVAEKAPPEQAGKILARGEEKVVRPAREAVVLARKLGERQLLAVAVYTMAQIHVVMRRGEASVNSGQEAMNLFTELGDRRGAAHSLLLSAEGNFLRRDLQKADSEAGQAWQIFSELSDDAGQAKAGDVMQKFKDQGSLSLVGLGGAAFGGPAAIADLAGMDAMSMAATESKKGIDRGLALKMAKETVVEAIGGDEEVDMDSPLMDIGLDSLASIAFREELIKTTGLQVPTSLVFDYPSLSAIADHLVEVSKE